jgi:hypothetical protein
MEKMDEGVSEMEDPAETEKKRPPAALPKEEGGEMVFYYSRARRLAKASEAVRKLNDPAPEKPPNLFRTLVATKPRAMTLATILFLSVIILLLSFFTGFDRKGNLGGNGVSASAMALPNATYVVIKKTAGKGQSYTGPVDLAATIPLKAEDTERGVEAPIDLRRIFFTLNAEEDFRFSLPFEARELLIVLRAGEERVSLRVTPD